MKAQNLCRLERRSHFSMNWKIVSLSLCTALSVANVLICPALSADERIAAKKKNWHTLLLEIYKSKGASTEVCGEYASLCALNPQDARMQYEYANYLWKANRVKEAQNAFRKLVAIDPSQDNHGLYGDFLNQQRNFPGALHEYQQGGQKYMPKAQALNQYLQQIKTIQQYNQQLKKQQEEGD